MFTFYQSFVVRHGLPAKSAVTSPRLQFDALEGRVIHATKYWTEANIADGLNALAICIEMVFFSAFMMWAYTWKEYQIPGQQRTPIGKPLWDR